MLLFLKNDNNGNVFFLTGKNQFIVGRKNCDLLIQDDQSISRKHAIILLKESKITVEDCGSKYHTLFKGENLIPNTEIELAVGDSIQFGVSHSLYSLHKLELVTTGTCLNNILKTKLISNLSAINGKYVDQWTSDCTHLTVEKITLTMKLLHALIDEKPILKPTYWSKFVESVQKNLPLPNIDLYNKPPIAEALLNKIVLSPNPKRKVLFNGKLFVFPTEKNKKQLEDVIKKAGGTSISWEKDPIPLEDIKKSPKEFLIIQSADQLNDPDLNEVIKIFAKEGKRTIPLQEIAMSIALCSCERDCNPSFNRVEQVFPSSGPKEPTQGEALAADTQSQQFTMEEVKVEGKEPLIIPGTFESKLEESEPYVTPLQSRINSQSMKRVNTDSVEENSLKKIKTDKGSETVVKRETLGDLQQTTFVSKDMSLRKKIKDDNQKESTSESKPNLFISQSKSKRSKTETNSSPKSHPFKRTKKDSGNTTQVNKENPFLLSLGNKKRTREDPSEFSIPKKKKDNTTENIFSSTKIENCSLNVSGVSRISRISKGLASDVWTSKNVTNASSTGKEKTENHFDIQMKEFIAQFKDTVIVEIMEKIPLKSKILRDHDLDSPNGKTSNKKNFKIFKKVMPLKPQKTIIGKNSFVSVSPGDTTDITDTRREIFTHSDDEAKETSKVKKKKPKKFLI